MSSDEIINMNENESSSSNFNDNERWTCEACGCHTNTEENEPDSCGLCGTNRMRGAAAGFHRLSSRFGFRVSNGEGGTILLRYGAPGDDDEEDDNQEDDNDDDDLAMDGDDEDDHNRSRVDEEIEENNVHASSVDAEQIYGSKRSRHY